ASIARGKAQSNRRQARQSQQAPQRPRELPSALHSEPDARPRLWPSRPAGRCPRELRPPSERTSISSSRNHADDHTDQQGARNRSEGIAPRHAFEFGGKRLGMLLGRRGKVGSCIHHATGGTSDLRGNGLAHVAYSLGPHVAHLRSETRERILQTSHVPTELA